METTREENMGVERETLYMVWRQDRELTLPRSLQRWIAEYPNFADDLVTWATDLPLLQPVVYRAEDLAEETSLAKVGRSVVAEMRAQYGMVAAPLVSLSEAAGRGNLRLKEVAERIGIGLPIVSKLEQRLLQFSTLPEALIRRLAETLELGTETVRDYLRQPPTLAAGAAYQYTGKSAPQVAAQQDFAEAIRSCPGMSEADKQAWLAEDKA
jgi:hypothetical protein